MEPLDRLASDLLAARKLLISTHRNPDGDGIGCQLALNEMLAGPDRRISLIASGPVPARFLFLPGSAAIRDWETLDTDVRDALLADIDLLLVVDTHEFYMLGPLGDRLQAAGIPARFLDHHPIKTTQRDGLFCNPDASSTGEICYHLLCTLDRPMTSRAATCLYAAIAYDTNFFKYLRGRPETHRVAAALMESGADADMIYRHAFASNSAARIALTRDMFQRFKLAQGGRIAYLTIDRDLITSTQATPDDMRDLITQLLEMDGVEIAITFKERDDGRIKISLRSKGRHPLKPITASLGGGGHLYASGAHVAGTLAEVTQHVLTLVSDLIGPVEVDG